MTVILWAFTLFHVVVGAACLGAAVRLLTPDERALWRSKLALLVAELLVWIYPIAAFVGVKSAWSAYDVAHPFAFAMILAPIAWLLVMGIAFAVVDFAEDGILGNARTSDAAR
ncbi:MAG: hypothetical protein H7124_03480 [Phycisphaerales bacterium]|nr:hypothetical protein [Hyphomonadaceae bacterium]